MLSLFPFLRPSRASQEAHILQLLSLFLMLEKQCPRKEANAGKNVSGFRAADRVGKVSVSPAAKSQMTVEIKQ